MTPPAPAARPSSHSTPTPAPGSAPASAPHAAAERGTSGGASEAAGTPPNLAPLDTFPRRHLGLPDAELQAMLDAIGVGSIDELIDRTVPRDIRLDKPLHLVGLDDAQPLGEAACLEKLAGYAALNRHEMTSMIGMGYHGTITPPVILRNVLENPLWYTPYTPYQAEIAQGRLEALLNFQTMVSDLVGLPLAGASLLDEGTAAAEAMAMCHGVAREKKRRFLVNDNVHPQTLAVVRTRAEGLGIELVVRDPLCPKGDAIAWGDISGVLVQYPDTFGVIEDYRGLVATAHGHGALVVAATDLLACCLITPPGEWGADIAVGSSQRFGVPMGYGGPHAAFIATKNEYARKLPGRIIGVSKDAHGHPAYRMAIQTREQHIKRDKATSNICTAQALLANVAGFYAAYHGPEGLKAIANRVHRLTRLAAEGFTRIFERSGAAARVLNADACFDTIVIELAGRECVDGSIHAAQALGLNLRDFGDNRVGISLDETTTLDDIKQLWRVTDTTFRDHDIAEMLDAVEAFRLPPSAFRHSPFLQHPVFNQYHTEHEMLRYLHRLASKDYGLAHGMIPLGSCTMKLNAAVEMIPVTWPAFANLHPFCPPQQAQGYRKLFDDLEAWLAEITGFAAVSLQPNAGSQGEYAGLMAIRAFHAARAGNREQGTGNSADASDGGESKKNSSSFMSDQRTVPCSLRTICLIPTSAHGTNPASAVIAGMTVVPVACKGNGDIDLDDLRAKATQHAAELSCLMITYPSTHGVFEDTIREACRIIHDHGGLVYMDGANMNAQVGLTSPGKIGADVCHLNLHKTFCIPHGGGGPGMGPIGVVEKLRPFLPGHPMMSDWGLRISEQDKEEPPSLASAHPKSEIQNPKCCISAAPFGSPMILPIPWVYIALMGATGLTQATKHAILNANYMAARLRGHYDVLFTGASGGVAHEFILDCRPFDKSSGITVDDIAKRLMDYGFHAPTMSWPVGGTLMIEPTESEGKAELDRFCDAMIAIREEIRRVESGEWGEADNPLKGAPHTAEHVTSDHWPHAYSREVAAYPLPSLRLSQAHAAGTSGGKFWPSVGRIDNPYGDRNLVCTCPPMESYAGGVGK